MDFILKDSIQVLTVIDQRWDLLDLKTQLLPEADDKPYPSEKG
jgi:hypothetical protein